VSLTEGTKSSCEKEKHPRLLLHTCCGPCATSVVERLVKNYRVECFFYNPNIHPAAEYGLRLDEAREVARIAGVPLRDDEYDADAWFDSTAGLENEPEAGKRCAVCFRKRLLRTAQRAKTTGCDYFATTLTVSPHKNGELINRIGSEISADVGVRFLAGDWKKENGYARSVELSKKYGLFRQNYCGCKFSRAGDT
jgi:predicted adenine nucleotide alpha hydrolase (AANH) superfamily ATPase